MVCKNRKRNHVTHSNEDIDYIIKNIKSLENSSVLTNGVKETVKHEIKREHGGGGFLGMLLGILGASILGNMLTAKES